VSQTNFFMNVEDDTEFLDMLSRRGDTAMIAGRFYHSPTPDIGQALPPFGTVQESHLVNLHITPTPTCSHQSDGGLWLFDMFRDVHIEFQRCYLHQGILVSGRIYAKIGWCANSQTNKAFRSWYSSIERWIKRKYHSIDSTFWVGPHAERWSQSGGLLAFGNPNAMTRSLAS